MELKEKRILLAHKNFVNRVIPINENIFASCSNDNTVKLWKLGFKKPYKSIKFPTYVYTIALVSDEFGT